MNCFSTFWLWVHHCSGVPVLYPHGRCGTPGLAHESPWCILAMGPPPSGLPDLYPQGCCGTPGLPTTCFGMLSSVIKENPRQNRADKGAPADAVKGRGARPRPPLACSVALAARTRRSHEPPPTRRADGACPTSGFKSPGDPPPHPAGGGGSEHSCASSARAINISYCSHQILARQRTTYHCVRGSADGRGPFGRTGPHRAPPGRQCSSRGEPGTLCKRIKTDPLTTGRQHTRH